MPHSRPTRIVLTHWNATVFRKKMWPLVFPELVIYCLLYDEVLIREEDVVANRKVTALLSEENTFDVFAEFLRSGLVKILRTPLDNYGSAGHWDPERHPITARAEEHEMRRTYKGRPWKPTQRNRQLFERLDKIVAGVPAASRFERDYPAENAFALHLAHILEHREAYQFSTHPSLGRIKAETADAFIRFCHEGSEGWQRFVRDHSRAKILGPSADFYRSAAYQCAQFLPNREVMERLVESVYAATYCEREDSDGRYGGGLIELPYRFESATEREEALELVTRVEVVPTSAAMKVTVDPGIAEVIRLTRESEAFASMKTALQLMTAAPMASGAPTESSCAAAWANLSEVYAEHWRKLMVRPSASVEQTITWVARLYVLARVCGVLVMPESHHRIDVGYALDESLKGIVIERLGPWLANAVRGSYKMAQTRDDLAGAASIRCSPVLLPALDRRRRR